MRRVYIPHPGRETDRSLSSPATAVCITNMRWLIDPCNVGLQEEAIYVPIFEFVNIVAGSTISFGITLV